MRLVGIGAAGVYAPRYRISAEAFTDAWGRFRAPGISEKAVPEADEDPLTMAVAAGEQCLRASGTDPATVEWVGLATTTPPVEDEDPTARLAAMLGLGEGTPTATFAESTRAGTRGLWGAMDAVIAGTEPALLLAADAPRGHPDKPVDHAAGAGAAAILLVGDTQKAPATITDRATATDPAPGIRFRRSDRVESEGLGITQYDRSTFVNTVGAAVSGLATDPAPDAVALQAPNGKLPYRAAGAIGVDTEAIQSTATVHTLGDTGAASALLALVEGLREDNSNLLAVGYGSGAGADAFVIDRQSGIPIGGSLADGTAIDYPSYLRRRGVVTSDPPAGGGAYVSIPSWTRTLTARYRQIAGQCRSCDALTFPPEGACPKCGSLEKFEQIHLPRRGVVEAATTISQGGAPPEFSELQRQSGEYAALIVAFSVDAETVSIPLMGTGAAPDAFERGTAVETTIRRIYTQEGVVRYGCKARPIELS